MKWVSFGEIVWDVHPQGKALGGAPLNVAAHAARHGFEAYVLSAVGNDELGDLALAQMREWGVHTDGVSVLSDRTTGVCDVHYCENNIMYHLREHVSWDVIDTTVLPAEADVLYFGTLALRSKHNREQLADLLSRGQFAQVVVDVNVRPPYCFAETLRFALEHATMLKISSEELATVCELLGLPLHGDRREVCETLCAHFDNIHTMILTCGGDGACAYHRESGEFCEAAAEKTEVVSAVGAGDSFLASFTAHRLQGEALDACLAHASKLAALVVAHTEAVPLYQCSDLR